MGGSKRAIGIPNSQLTCIDERTSESGFKDVIDRKEFEYQYEIQKINHKITDFDSVTTLIKEQIEHIHNFNQDIQKNKRIIAEKTIKIDEMQKRDDKLSNVMDILIKNEKTLLACGQRNLKSINKQSIDELQKLLKEKIAIK